MEMGYGRFNIVDQDKIHMTTDFRPPEDEQLPGPSTYAFRRGSSGTFGDRLGGPWLDYEATKSWLLRFLDEVEQRNARAATGHAFGTWYDIHAALG